MSKCAEQVLWGTPSQTIAYCHMHCNTQGTSRQFEFRLRLASLLSSAVPFHPDTKAEIWRRKVCPPLFLDLTDQLLSQACDLLTARCPLLSTISNRFGLASLGFSLAITVCHRHTLINNYPPEGCLPKSEPPIPMNTPSGVLNLPH